AAYPAAFRCPTRKVRAVQTHPQRPKRRDTPHSKRFALFGGGLAALCCFADFQSAALRLTQRAVLFEGLAGWKPCDQPRKLSGYTDWKSALLGQGSSGVQGAKLFPEPSLPAPKPFGVQEKRENTPSVRSANGLCRSAGS